MLEKLSTTRVMRYITDRTIRKEGVFFVLLYDFFYSIFLLLGYRLNVEFILYAQVEEKVNEGYISGSILEDPIFYAAVVVFCYYLVKQLIMLMLLYRTSKSWRDATAYWCGISSTWP